MKKEMLNKRIGKRGIAIGTIIGLIIVILGFVILIWFFYLVYSQLTWSGKVDRTVCEQSVVFRATLPGTAGSKELVPLKCKTQKICITSGLIGGKCKEFENSKGIIKVKAKNKGQIEKYIAGEIIDCWRMMGEGKVSIFSQWIAENYGIGSVYPSCVICSRIAFDKENLEKAGIKASEIDVIKYMMTHAVPNTNKSYYEHLTEQGGKVSAPFRQENFEIYELFLDEKSKEGVRLLNEEGIAVTYEEAFTQKNDNKELAVLFMQISAPSHSGVLKNTALTLGIGWGASFIFAPKMVSKSTIAALKSPWAWAILAAAGIYQQYSVSQNRGITAGYCGDIAAGSEAREGCSVVRTVNYNYKDISQYCSYIESIA